MLRKKTPNPEQALIGSLHTEAEFEKPGISKTYPWKNLLHKSLKEPADFLFNSHMWKTYVTMLLL